MVDFKDLAPSVPTVRRNGKLEQSLPLEFSSSGLHMQIFAVAKTSRFAAWFSDESPQLRTHVGFIDLGNVSARSRRHEFLAHMFRM